MSTLRGNRLNNDIQFDIDQIVFIWKTETAGLTS